MTRKTFFSYHYVPDVWRAWNVRNTWVVKDSEEESAGFFDSSVFEASKKESNDALKAFLRKGLENTSVTCVLAGTETWSRRWVRYEIVRSVLKGNGLLTVFIHDVENSKKEKSVKGKNPLDHIGVYKTDSGIFFAEWREGKWVKYADYTLSIPEKDLTFDSPKTTGVIQLSSHYLSYEFVKQNGRENIGGWIETAAGLAGR